MNLTDHYNLIYHQSVAKIAAGEYEIDPLIDSKTDYRFGMTLVIRPDEDTKARIQYFLDEAKEIEPDQYYYPDTDIHITLLSVISCYGGFDLQNIQVGQYVELIEKALAKHKRFKIQLNGLTASPSCILLQGFFPETLNAIRNDLRIAFKNSTLQQSIDKRYTLQTAHATVIRFRKELKNKIALLNLIEKYRDFDFGTFEVNRIELVYNDWYQRDQFVKKLHVFTLQSSDK